MSGDEKKKAQIPPFTIVGDMCMDQATLARFMRDGPSLSDLPLRARARITGEKATPRRARAAPQSASAPSKPIGAEEEANKVIEALTPADQERVRTLRASGEPFVAKLRSGDQTATLSTDLADLAAYDITKETNMHTAPKPPPAAPAPEVKKVAIVVTDAEIEASFTSLDRWKLDNETGMRAKLIASRRSELEAKKAKQEAEAAKIAAIPATLSAEDLAFCENHGFDPAAFLTQRKRDEADAQQAREEEAAANAPGAELVPVPVVLTQSDLDFCAKYNIDVEAFKGTRRTELARKAEATR